MAATAAHAYEGRCLCGAVAVRVQGSPGDLVYCHCGQCRKSSGAAFLAVFPVPASAVTVLDPEGRIREYRATPGKARAFCGRCGATLLSRRDGQDMVRLRGGLFERLDGIAHAGHIFTADAADWNPIGGDLPRYAGIEPARATSSSSD